MSDRRPSLFSRFMGSTTPAPPRRTPAAQTPARPQPPTSDRPAIPPPTESQATASASPTSKIRSNVQPGTPSRRSPAVTTTNNQSIPNSLTKPDSSTTNLQLTNARDSKAPRSSDESKNSTPTGPNEGYTKPLPSSTQSRSPPLPSSPARVTPQPQSTPLSPSRMGAQAPSTPPLRSPSRVASRSTKPTSPPSTIRPQLKSSPKESLTKSRSKKGMESPSSSKESGRSQETNNPPAPAKVSNPPEHLERRLEAVIEPNQHLGGKKEVKEVVQAINTEADEHNGTKKAIKVAEIPSKQQASINVEEALEKKEIPSASRSNKESIKSPISQVRNKTMIPDTGNNLDLNKDIKRDLSAFANRMAIADHSKTDNTPSVITLAGENRGAVMQIGTNSTQRDGPVHINRGYKLNAETTTDEDQENDKENKSGDSNNGQDQAPETAYVNNNTQALNNSIVLSSSVSERDPGVHIVITKESVTPMKAAETRKVEFNTSASKVAYQPTVRRRCLRGMLLESSDSDPEKPRRHGCRVPINDTGF